MHCSSLVSLTVLYRGVICLSARAGWSGGAMVLGKLPVPGRPTNFDCSRARAYYACNRCGWGFFGHFFSRLSFLLSFSLSLGDGPIKTEILSQRAVKPKTNQQPTKSVCPSACMFVRLVGNVFIPKVQVA